MSGKKIRPAVYVRVSTKDQKLAAQLADVKDFCRRRGWPAPAVYQEKASGAKASRTVLGEMLDDARARKFDVLVIYKLDRLGRSISHLLQIFSEFRNLGVGIVCTSQPIDTTDANPLSNLQLSILAAFAEFERDLNLERTLIGIAHARRRGKHMGRPRGSDDALTLALKMRNAGEPLADCAKSSGLSISYISKEYKKLKLAPGGD